MSLSDHKKVGKRFVTPLNEIGIEGISYYRELFPELLWMGFVREQAIAKDAIAMILEFAKAAKEIRGDARPVLNFSFVSSYRLLGDSEKTQLIAAVPEETLLRFQEALAPLNLIYSNYPLAFIGQPRDPIDRDALLAELKRVIAKYSDKYDQAGMFIQATAFYVRVASGQLILTNGVSMPNLNKIFLDPDSDEGKMAASSVRAAIMTEAAMMEPSEKSWAREFWNQGAEIDGCQF